MNFQLQRRLLSDNKPNPGFDFFGGFGEQITIKKIEALYSITRPKIYFQDSIICLAAPAVVLKTLDPKAKPFIFSPKMSLHKHSFTTVLNAFLTGLQYEPEPLQFVNGLIMLTIRNKITF